MSELSKEQIAHGAAIARRRAINGQPNGYRPISEVELQEIHASRYIKHSYHDSPRHDPVPDLVSMVDDAEHGYLIRNR